MLWKMGGLLFSGTTSSLTRTVKRVWGGVFDEMRSTQDHLGFSSTSSCTTHCRAPPSHVGGHFQAVRFTDRLYAERTEPGPNGESMFNRVQEACAALGLYVPPVWDPEGGRTTAITSLNNQSEESDFVPSFSVLSDSSVTEFVSASQYIKPVDLACLYRHFNPHRRYRGELATVWRQVDTKNYLACLTWEHPHPSADSVAPSSGPDSINAEVRRYANHPEVVTSLLRALPYPKVAISLLPGDLIRRVGQEVLLLCRMELLRTVKTSVPPQEVRDSIDCWLQEMATQDPFELRWNKSSNFDLTEAYCRTGRPT